MTSRGLLHKALRQLAATGSAGFEGLIQRLLTDMTGYQFYLAKAGSQGGRDMSSDRGGATVLAVECKRYGSSAELDNRELLGELAQAVDGIPQLDVWVLAASREVPDQLYSELHRHGERLNIEVQVLSLGEGSAGSLDVLCAHSPEIVAGALRALAAADVRAVLEELERIRSDIGFDQRSVELRRRLTESAGLDAVRRGLHDWLRARFRSESESRAALGQSVDVDARRDLGLLVRRAETNRELDRWLASWPEGRTGLAVLGEEGDGKTWAVASWLSERLSHDARFPPVLWVSSQEVTVQDVETLLGAAMTNRLRGGPEAWAARLHRWAAPAERDGPVVVLVLDGINERRDASWWRPLIESLGSGIWRGAVATVVTSRTGFWPSVGRFPHSRFSESVVPAYNDRELALAIEQRGVQREELPDEILPLVRKPRYLEMALRHRLAMAESGDVTVARLVYEDWRDRETRRAGLPSADAFQTALMELAAKSQRESRGLARRDVIDATAGLEGEHALLRELETGGVLVQDGRRWRVEPRRLALGLGLLLVDRLCDRAVGRPPAEVLASWMEPQPAIDLKAQILENATLHALRTSDCSSEIRRLLLVAWLTHRNQARPTGHSVTAYFPMDPECYLSAAESVWSDDTNDGWAEEVLKATYAHWASLGGFTPHFTAAFGRWLGLVHVDGSPIGTDSQGQESRRAAMREILGRELLPGPFEYAGTDLVATDDEGLLRLGRLALAIMSDLDRRPFVSALTTAYLAEALMQHPDRLDLCSWIIRTSEVDLWPSLEPDVRRFIRVGSRPALEAAYRLLGSIGTARAREMRNGLPEDLFPVPQFMRDLQTDPCVSWFAWRTEDCARCAEREDVPTHIVAQNLARCVRDPGFVVPRAAVRRLNDMLESVDPTKMWCGVSTTGQEHRFETVELALASGGPSAISRTVKSIGMDLRQRRGLSLRQAAYQLSDYRLALSVTELEAVREVWEGLRALGSAADQEAERAECLLFELLLPGLAAAEQLDFLLARHPDALLDTRFRRQFKPLPWPAIAHRLHRSKSDGEISRILFFATANADCVDECAAADLARYVESSDRLVRLSALQLIHSSGLAGAVDAVVGGHWHFDGQADNAACEDHWGSVLLAKRGQRLSYDELRTRVLPTYLGRAVAARGFKPEEIQRYAEDLDRVWEGCGAGDEPQPDVASIEVRAPASRSDELDLPSVPQSVFSRTVTFFTRHASWGGVPDQASLADVMNPATDEDLKALQDNLRETLFEQRRARNEWFAQRFSLDCLPEVLASRPELVRRWLGDPIGNGGAVATRAWFGRSFYESLCEVLLTQDPAVGVELYHWLRHQSPAVNFVERDTDAALLDHALFQAKDCPELRAVWDSYLDAARSDRDLLVLAVLAESGSASSWLADRLATDLMSPVPLRKTRAVTLRGFVGGESAPAEPVPLETDVVEWQREQHERAVQNWQMNKWAQQWFAKFTSAESDDIALGAFRLFLACVDSRFLLWRNAALTELPEDRRRFLSSARDRIERAIRKNEEGHRKNFLGMRVADRQVWPWT